MPSVPPVRPRRWGRVAAALVGGLTAVVLLTTGLVALTDRVSQRPGSLAVRVLSSRPDAVTGGNARIAVDVPAGVAPDAVRVTLNGRAESSLRMVPGGLEGVVPGLAVGPNALRVAAPAATAAEVTLVNHPITGPLLAGPQEQPFFCQTKSFQLVTGESLGPPVDDQCSIVPREDFVYRSSTTKTFRSLTRAALTDPAQRPADLATVRSPDGKNVPFIVRLQTRTIDRGISEVATLVDGSEPSRDLWNRKLVYTFGGGCDKGWYVQGTTTGGVLSARLLARGYAVASNSLNVFGQNCNDLLAAEAFAMTREQFIEDHGLPSSTLGVGCSGGSYQAHQIADNYPGLLDGILAGCSFADVASDTSQKLFDGRLLSNYYRSFPGRLTPEQQRLVSGFGSLAAVEAMGNAAGRLNPRGNFSSAVPARERYHPDSNLGGARSTIWDHTVNVYGRSAKTGFARRPLDNVGVQYGLQPFQQGAITAEQFLDLNQKIGGFDLDLKGTSARTAADQGAVTAAYSTGRVLDGGGGLGQLPIVDVRSYTEGSTSTDIHMRYHTFVTQARLVAANGDADNRVLLTVDGERGFDLERGVVAEAFDALDRWVDAVQSSGSSGHRAVVQAKPTGLVDACWTPQGDKIVERQTYQGSGQCSQLYPAHSAPRLVAGAPLASNVLACTLRPVDPGSYSHRFTAAQLSRLRAVFPDGVCDWTQPGRWQRRPTGPWLFLR